MNGGSHTNFNGGAIISGGMTAGGLIGGALVTGAMNALAQARVRRAREWTQAEWEDALKISEDLRRRDHERANKSERENASLRVEIARLRNKPTLSAARAMRAH